MIEPSLYNHAAQACEFAEDVPLGGIWDDKASVAVLWSHFKRLVKAYELVAKFFDPTPVDDAWLASLGCEQYNSRTSQRLWSDDDRTCLSRDPLTSSWRVTGDDMDIEIPQLTTRGEVRMWCYLLKIQTKGT